MTNTNLFKDFLLVFIGGGVGSCLRFSASLAAKAIQLNSWWATLFVNIVGAFIMLLLSFKFDLSHDNSRLIKVGLLGALTTFSTFSLEIVGAFKNGQPLEGLSILTLNILLGIVIGIWIFR